MKHWRMGLLIVCVSILNSRPSGAQQEAAREQVGKLADGSFLLPTGWRIQPVGTQVPVDTFPMSSALSRDGKFLLVLTTALTTAALSVISMGISFTIANSLRTTPIQAGEEGATLHIGFAAALSVFIMAIPLAVLFSSVLITISTFAKSYKEAQSYIMPIIFLVIIPAIAAMLPGVELTPKLALVPVLNVSLLCKELVIGTYHWNYIAIIFASTCVYASAALFLAIKMFQREDVLFRS